MGDVPFLTREDVNQLKDYVKGTGGTRQAESTVTCHISHSNLKQKFFEVRLDKHMTIERVKTKLSFHCGTSPNSMILELLDDASNSVAHMNDDSRMLGYYSPHNGYVIHITDTDPTSMSVGGWLEDVSLVDKYKISDEAYNAREKTYRKFKADKQAADPEWTLEKEMATRKGLPYTPPPPKVTDPEYAKDAALKVEVGQRCSVDPGDRRGVVRYVGHTVAGLPLGYWIGVQYDEPCGKNDGSINGVKLFDCPDGYGGMLRPDKVQVGNYPAIDEFAEEDPDEI